MAEAEARAAIGVLRDVQMKLREVKLSADYKSTCLKSDDWLLRVASAELAGTSVAGVPARVESACRSS